MADFGEKYIENVKTNLLISAWALTKMIIVRLSPGSHKVYLASLSGNRYYIVHLLRLTKWTNEKKINNTSFGYWIWVYMQHARPLLPEFSSPEWDVDVIMCPYLVVNQSSWCVLIFQDWFTQSYHLFPVCHSSFHFLFIWSECFPSHKLTALTLMLDPVDNIQWHSTWRPQPACTISGGQECSKWDQNVWSRFLLMQLSALQEQQHLDRS